MDPLEHKRVAEKAKRPHTRLDRIAQQLGACRSVVIVTHDNPDPDALASAYAMRYLLWRRFRKSSQIVYQGEIGRAENRALAKLLRIPLRTAARFRFSSRQKVVMVDAQPGAGNTSLPRSAKPSVVVDHHPVRRSALKAPYHDLRPDCGATSTVLTQYLRAAKIPIPPKVATALFFGIQTDTLDLSRQATPADYAAYRRLFPLVDHRLLTDIEHPELPPMFFQVALAAIQQAVCYGDLIFSNLGDVAVAESIPQMADYLAQMEKIRWSAVIGRVNGELRLSLRAWHTPRDAGQLLRRVVGKRGDAGGHGTAAGGHIPIDKLSPEEIHELEAALRQRFVELLASKKSEPVPLSELRA